MSRGPAATAESRRDRRLHRHTLRRPTAARVFAFRCHRWRPAPSSLASSLVSRFSFLVSRPSPLASRLSSRLSSRFSVSRTSPLLSPHSSLLSPLSSLVSLLVSLLVSRLSSLASRRSSLVSREAASVDSPVLDRLVAGDEVMALRAVHSARGDWLCVQRKGQAERGRQMWELPSPGSAEHPPRAAPRDGYVSWSPRDGDASRSPRDGATVTCRGRNAPAPHARRRRVSSAYIADLPSPSGGRSAGRTAARA